MMKLMALALGLVSLVACNKDEETYTVVYSVEVEQPVNAQLEANYTDERGQTVTISNQSASNFERRIVGLKSGTRVQFSGFLKTGPVQVLKGEAELEVYDSKGNKVWEADKKFNEADHTLANQLGFSAAEVKEKTQFDLVYTLQ